MTAPTGGYQMRAPKKMADPKKNGKGHGHAVKAEKTSPEKYPSTAEVMAIDSSEEEDIEEKKKEAGVSSGQP